MGPRKKDKKTKETSKDDTILLSDDSTHSTPTTPVNKRSSGGKRKRTQRLVEDDLTPEKIPNEVETPRKSRHSKDMSPPPLKHRQNRIPEQHIMVNDESKFFVLFYFVRITMFDGVKKCNK